MITRILVPVLFCFSICSAISASSQAQTLNPACLSTTSWWNPDPIPWGWFPYAPEGAKILIIAAYNTTCSPPPKCPCGNAPSPQAGKPIFLATGDTFIDDTDVSLPGLGGGITFRRRWNSVWPTSELSSSVGIFGQNWRSSYEERIFMGGDHYVTYARGDGSYWSFGRDPATGTWLPVSPANAPVALSGSTLIFRNGERRQFSDITGLLTAIIDRNGNTTLISYDSLNRLTTVTDPASRHLYFNYANASSLLVTSVTSDFGVTLTYGYDSNERLNQVTRPDTTTVSYTYNSQSQITLVTDSNGKVLESHTYDSNGRGLTSSQANGVNTVTVNYPN